MITWIQRYFAHHFKTIFAVLLAVTIISFIFTIGASPGIGRGDRRVVDRQFFGYNLSLQDDSARLMGDASISANLQLGSMGGLESEQIQNYAFQRAATLALADEWHIPAPTTTEIADAIKSFNKATNVHILLHSDAAQSVGKVCVDVQSSEIDLLTIVGHKYGAPKGVAALFVREGVRWDPIADSTLPMLIGGGQERGARGGEMDYLNTDALLL